ncbi:thermonuclease family protein [Aurantiacibacter sediminis]|uniref:Nuclease n=1 Tax=Aurantiacibacter sediminis TaxID=2793064 RepID=A0ABS0N059_9SPHN|nr:hypothetical protein [Aurantiacibacter sediminis]MBH5321117.1 hypothetical protein [Aurantiacibacter sediminis]
MIIIAAAWAYERFGYRSAEWDMVDYDWIECGTGSGAACVIDGDTLVIGHRRIRLTGFDTPERDGACEAERRLASVARYELTRWLNRGSFEMDGGAEPPRDQYGRELRSARRAGEQVADYMVARNLARRSGFDQDWCAGEG